MQKASSTIIPGGSVNPVPLNYPAGVQGCIIQNPTGYNAYIGDSLKNVLVKVPSGLGLSFPLVDTGLYCWTDASPGVGFSAGGQVRVTMTSADLQYSSGEINADFVVPGAVVSFNSRTGAVTLTSADVTGALTFTPADQASTMRSAPSAPVAVVPGASPWTYTNGTQFLQQVLVSGGTVSAIALSGDGGANFRPTGATSGVVLLAPGHQLRITYSVVPTVFEQEL